MTTPFRSAIYQGVVMHQRHRPKPHRLSYRVFSLLLDLDEVPRLAHRLRLFSHNRFNLLALYDRDHGPGDGSALRPWLEAQLAKAGIVPDGGRIAMLCYPRLLGFVFNPLTVYYCHDCGDRLRAVLYEVRNTFGQRHCYLIPVTPDQIRGEQLRQACDKCFYVSPFIPMQAHYDFRLKLPGERLVLAIHESDGDGALLDARFTARRRDLSDASILRLMLTHPLMTLKVVAGIHWEALHLWRKGAPFFHRPIAPAEPVTFVAPNASR